MGIYNTIFYQPILNLLVWLHNAIPGSDFGWAIIALTLVIKIILWPLSGKFLKSQKALQTLQPKVDELRARYKDKKQELSKAMIELYRAEKINPFSSCLPLLIQFPFLIAIFQILRDGIQNGALAKLYPFVAAPTEVSTMFLGVFNLSSPSIPLAVIAGVSQFIQTKMLIKKPQPKLPGAQDENMAAMVNKQMTYFMPMITIVIGATLPGGLSLYWIINTLATIAQQMLVMRDKKI